MATNEYDPIASPSGGSNQDPKGSKGNTTKQNGANVAGRNIILLSDGTGNSAAKMFKTNVWRLYESLDLTNGRQIAFYDGGVGTSGFKPLQILGGAFGWGLSRNVRDLYKFLCRHYEPGDHIYTFGFSRGAFTVRTLAGLVVNCGILDPNREVPDTNMFTRRTVMRRIGTDRGLKVAVKLAYRSYRRRYPKEDQPAPIVRIARKIRDAALGESASRDPRTFREQFSLDEQTKIQCVGVWDTVDAVGLPIDELSVALDKWFYPHRFPDQDLSADINNARHAVAIDDERHTFHTVLWNEQGMSDQSRIKQVWFAGMHSNVGGGYPDDDLAHVSLKWMIDEVRRRKDRPVGLDFDEESVRQIGLRVVPTGRMHDSRRGAAVYYRYKPRRIRDLCNDTDNGVCIEDPKIHCSVIERIAETTAGYAPAGLPDEFKIVDHNGDQSAFVEAPEDRARRVDLLGRTQSHIFWRRVFYFVLLFLTGALVAMPHYFPPIPGAEAEGFLGSLLAGIFDRLAAFLPSLAGCWMDTWVQNPRWFGILAVGLVAVLWHRRNIAANTQHLAEAAWWHLRRRSDDGTLPDLSGLGPFEKFASRLHRSGGARRFYRVWVKHVLPKGFLLVLLWLAGVFAYRILVHYPRLRGGLCGTPDAAQIDSAAPKDFDSGSGTGAKNKDFVFSTRQHCLNTGLILHAGQPYTVDIEILEPWMDESYGAGIAGFDDFTDRFALPFLFGFPARRDLSMPWFTLLGEIGQEGEHVFPMNRSHFRFTPKQTGRLFLYVNDAINSLGRRIDVGDGETSREWYGYYLNNKGEAKITVSWDR